MPLIINDNTEYGIQNAEYRIRNTNWHCSTRKLHSRSFKCSHGAGWLPQKWQKQKQNAWQELLTRSCGIFRYTSEAAVNEWCFNCCWQSSYNNYDGWKIGLRCKYFKNSSTFLSESNFLAILLFMKIYIFLDNTNYKNL